MRKTIEKVLKKKLTKHQQIMKAEFPEEFYKELEIEFYVEIDGKKVPIAS